MTHGTTTQGDLPRFSHFRSTSEPVGMASEPAGRALNPVGRAFKQARRASEEAGMVRASWVSLGASWERLRASWEGLRASWPGGGDGNENEKNEKIPLCGDALRGRCPKMKKVA